MEEKILACNNDKCIKNKECERYRLYSEENHKEYSTNGGNEQKGCKKFIERTK